MLDKFRKCYKFTKNGPILIRIVKYTRKGVWESFRPEWTWSGRNVNENRIEIITKNLTKLFPAGKWRFRPEWAASTFSSNLCAWIRPDSGHSGRKDVVFTLFASLYASNRSVRAPTQLELGPGHPDLLLTSSSRLLTHRWLLGTILTPFITSFYQVGWTADNELPATLVVTHGKPYVKF